VLYSIRSAVCKSGRMGSRARVGSREENSSRHGEMRTGSCCGVALNSRAAAARWFVQRELMDQGCLRA
jgi:hypothetical protein